MKHTQSHINLAQTNIALRFPNLNVHVTPAFSSNDIPKEGKVEMTTFVQSKDKKRLVYASTFLSYTAYTNPFEVIERCKKNFFKVCESIKKNYKFNKENSIAEIFDLNLK